MSPVPLNICYYTIKINVAYQNNSFPELDSDFILEKAKGFMLQLTKASICMYLKMQCDVRHYVPCLIIVHSEKVFKTWDFLLLGNDTCMDSIIILH